jgi:filamentous hemagglutinin family protein
MVILPTAPAQVVLDGTMGRSGELNGPNYQIGAELGQLHDSNLFHSFKEFSLTSSESAIFYRTNGVRNIISRVTGGNPSNINGTLGSEANLYFLNPYGIMFGPNAKLNVQGSFYASTADTLRFEDGGQFNARNTSDSVLTVAPIQAFGFLSSSPAALSVNGSELSSVNTGNTLSFIGGDLSIKNAKLSAPAGQIDLVGVGSEGDAKLSNGFLDLSSFSQLADIYIEKSLVDASTDTEMGGKGINVRANNLTLNDGRLVSYTSGTGKGGDITIDATGLVELRLGSAEEDTDNNDDTTHEEKELISVRTEGAGDGGNIELKARQLHITDRDIGSFTKGSGKGGNLYITVMENITVSGDSIIGAQTYEGDGGDVVLEAREVTLQNGGMISSNGYKTGQSGNIILKARQLHIVDGAQINSATKGSAPGGHINIEVTESIKIYGKGLEIEGDIYPMGIFASSEPPFSESEPEPVINEAGEIVLGDAGNIFLTADELIMEGPGPSVVAAITAYGSGKGGEINIKVGKIKIAESFISARSINSSGDAGNITLNVADSLRIQTGSSIRTTAEGAGGGNISINSQGYLFLTDGSEISSSVFTETGDGGDITLTPKFIVFDDSPSIQARAYEGHGGEISVTTKGVYNNTEGRYIELEDSFDATSEFGVDGVVTINSPEVENFEELLRLRDDFLRAEDQLLGERCEGLTQEDLSTFRINNRDTPAENPTDLKKHLILDW